MNTMTTTERLHEMEAIRDQMHAERTAHIKAANALFSESDQLSKRIGSLRQELTNASRGKRKDVEEVTT